MSSTVGVSSAAIRPACGTSVPDSARTSRIPRRKPPPHALRATLNQIQDFLRTALQLFEQRFFATARSVVSIEPTTKNARVQLGFTSSHHCPHTPLSEQRIAFSARLEGYRDSLHARLSEANRWRIHQAPTN